LSASASESAEPLNDRREVEHLLAELEEMVSICSHLVDTIAAEAATFGDGPLPDPFYSSSFD